MSSNAMLQMEDRELYITDFSENKVVLLDAENPKSLQLLAEFQLDGEIKSSYIRNSIGYFSISGSGVEIWDLTDRANPEEVSNQPFSNDATPSMACNMGYAYCLSLETLYCYNISGYRSFDLVCQIDIGPQSSDPILQANNDYLYLMNASGFYIFNISNPAVISILSESIYLNALDFYVVENHGYILTSEKTLAILDLADPTTPEQICNYLGPWSHFLKWFREEHWTFRTIVVESDFAYIGFTGNVGIYRIDISDPKSPITEGFFQCCPQSNIVVFENILYVLDSVEGLVTFDTTNPNIGFYNLLIFFMILYVSLLILSPLTARLFKVMKKKRIEMADNDFAQRMERAAAAGKKPIFALDDKELLEKFQKLMKISQKVSQKQICSFLGVSEENLLPKLVEWGSQLPIRIDGEWISIDNVQSFMDTLDSQFIEWNEKETTKVGKAE